VLLILLSIEGEEWYIDETDRMNDRNRNLCPTPSSK